MPTDFDLSFDTDDVIEAEDSRQFGIPLQNVERGATWYGKATKSVDGGTDRYAVTVNSEEDYEPRADP